MMYTQFDPEKFQDKRTAVIDGDGFAWAIGWLNKDALLDKQVTDAVDSCVHDILQGVRAEHFIGVLSPLAIQRNEPGTNGTDMDVREALPNFRKAIAKTRPYKGNRPERPEWYTKWCPIIENHLEQAWGFIRTSEGYEADDMVATLMRVLTEAGAKPICCGNDKDLLQIPGMHFNVKKKTMQDLHWYPASYNLWIQVLTGDDTDNVVGLSGLGTNKPGLGPKGAEKILSVCKSDGSTLSFREASLLAYVNKFGEDLGIQKFYETYMLVKLRTDIPTDDLDITEVCRGYDLAKYELEVFTTEESTEEIPDFSQSEE